MVSHVTRFETEAKGNSEMAYLVGYFSLFLNLTKILTYSPNLCYHFKYVSFALKHFFTENTLFRCPLTDSSARLPFQSGVPTFKREMTVYRDDKVTLTIW